MEVSHSYIINKAGGEQHEDGMCDFIDMPQPLFKSIG